jgi:serine phosphatase RsbU (regulator of sigma subunit)
MTATLVVGRTRDCGFTIEDSAASRRHLEISARQNSFVWKDLGSTNGTLLNGTRMLAGEIKHGDLIQIGQTVLRFEVEEVSEPETKLEESGLFRETILDNSGVAQRASGAGKSAELLEAVYSVMNEIATNYQPCQLIDRILEVTIGAIKAQWGAIFLAGEGEDLLPCPECGFVHRIRDGVLHPARIDEIRMSRTVVRRVLRDGESVLYQDTDSDSELNAAESIMSLNLRSIVCVPLRAKHGILGILYIDSNRENQAYTHEDLLLASAMGNSAGLALENAEMHQEILEKQRMEQEIATAWTIQEGFLVKEWPDTDPRFQVYGETRPAKTVGGDFYDFVQPTPDRIGLLIGDVSGKGVPAALTMAQLLAEFRLHARALSSPAAVIRRLNAGLEERSQRGLFCTLCYLTLDLETGVVTCANAGHLPVVRIGAEGVCLFAEASGPPAGILADAAWTDVDLTIAPGETLLLYTDGIAEARGTPTGHGEELEPVEYGLTGLMHLVENLYGEAPEVLLETVNRDVRRFCAPAAPHDDCTMAAIRYLGHANGH